MVENISKETFLSTPLSPLKLFSNMDIKSPPSHKLSTHKHPKKIGPWTSFLKSAKEYKPTGQVINTPPFPETTSISEENGVRTNITVNVFLNLQIVMKNFAFSDRLDTIIAATDMGCYTTKGIYSSACSIKKLLGIYYFP